MHFKDWTIKPSRAMKNWNNFVSLSPECSNKNIRNICELGVSPFFMCLAFVSNTIRNKFLGWMNPQTWTEKNILMLSCWLPHFVCQRRWIMAKIKQKSGRKRWERLSCSHRHDSATVRSIGFSIFAMLRVLRSVDFYKRRRNSFKQRTDLIFISNILPRFYDLKLQVFLSTNTFLAAKVRTYVS